MVDNGDGQTYDLAVIGAGIYGAALAYEASQRGMLVLVLEKDDVGAAASANSLKVIHGGLRYLQSLDVARTTYSAAERRVLMRLAPNLVRPMHCLVPLSRTVVKNELSVGLVAFFYNWLTRRRNEDMPAGSRIPDAGVVSLQTYQQNAVFPLREAGQFALDWHDAQAVDTERLLTLFLKDAQRAGASIRNYHSLTDLQRVEGVWELTALSRREQIEKRFLASAVVDCSGAWSAAERILMPERPRDRETPYVKAVNLITRKRLGEAAFGFNSRHGDQGRLLFTTPCGAHTLIGTWYYDENLPDAMDFSFEEAETCVAEINAAFDRPVLSVDEITHVHVGYLPADRRSAGQQSDPEAWLMRHNQTLSWSEHPDLWVIKGTKYTTARYEAEQFLLKHPALKASGKARALGDPGFVPEAGAEPGRGGGATPVMEGEGSAVDELKRCLPAAVYDAMAARYGRCFGDLASFIVQECPNEGVPPLGGLPLSDSPSSRATLRGDPPATMLSGSEPSGGDTPATMPSGSEPSGGDPPATMPSGSDPSRGSASGAPSVNGAPSEGRSTDLLAGTSTHVVAEVLYAVRREWAWHLDDILVRRLGLGSLEKPSDETVAHCLAILCRFEGWNMQRCEAEVRRLQAVYQPWLSSQRSPAASQ